MRRFLLLSLLLLASTAAGCGGSGADDGTDPAALMPKDAAVYFEAVVRPEGQQKEDLEALAAKILRTDDPGQKIVELIDKGLAKDGASYEEDIEPWLGHRAGGYVTGFDREEPTFGMAVGVTDADGAEEQLAEEAKEDNATPGSYEGVDYWVDEEKMVSAVVEDALVVTSSAKELEAMVDASKGDSLAESDRYKNAVDGLPDDRVGHFFIDFRPIIQQAASAPDAEPGMEQIFGQFIPKDTPPSVTAILADGDSIAFESVAEKPESGSAKGFGQFFGQGSEAPPLVKELPGDSWLGLGIPDVGATAKTLFDGFAGAFGGALFEQQIRKETGLDLDRDVFSWIGDVGVFVRGKTADTVDGGVVIEVTDSDAARTAIQRLVAAGIKQTGAPIQPVRIENTDLAFELTDPTSPKSVVIALAGDRAVVAYGRAAAEAGLSADDTLGDSGLYDQAKKAIDGLEPSFLIDGPSALTLLAATTAADDAGDFAKAKPYLDLIGVIAAGAEEDGDEVRSRVAVEVK